MRQSRFPSSEFEQKRVEPDDSATIPRLDMMLSYVCRDRTSPPGCIRKNASRRHNMSTSEWLVLS